MRWKNFLPTGWAHLQPFATLLEYAIWLIPLTEMRTGAKIYRLLIFPRTSDADLGVRIT